MWFLEQLLWNLPEVVDEPNGGVLLQRIVNGVDVDVTLVEQMMEYVDRIDRRLAELAIAKYKIDPFVEMGTDVIAFERLPMNTDELAGILFGPGRKNDVAQGVTVLLGAWIDKRSTIEYNVIEIVKKFTNPDQIDWNSSGTRANRRTLESAP